ncbi:hypothetical protein SU86_003235 [Candidatus Nitrosotenuis cloacae]|uniref:Uncharacterized protein n=2 Tax=Candidatus Nitrosotenuis cloacae TaxID=1603555 RepID=A0A3G1B092_9ARCH|nr:hypothetical protein SU86_003235 [Candidatus Nitrosotenuis cloacae]
MAKTGCIAGLVGGFALFSSFFWIDNDIGVPFGTFYKIVGMLVGLDGLPAIMFGFFAHMLTAALIGAIFCICSTLHRLLQISGVPKGIIGGAVTGIQVYAIFFMPITLYLMMPMISDQASGLSLVSSEQMEIAKTLLATSNDILWGSLILHVLYGSVMGLFCSFMLYEDYSMKDKIKKEKKEKWEKSESEHWPST